jgi:glycosyltransferase involved in cell wall biosynthesis
MRAALPPSTDGLDLAARPDTVRPHRPAVGIAAFPLIEENPYQRMLYATMAPLGLRVVEDADFKLGWLLRGRSAVRILHFHWPQNYYRWWRRPARLRRPLSWVKLALFGARLAVTRLLGFAVVWTIHEVYPHERSEGRHLDRLGGKLLARFSNVLIAHDEGTVRLAREQLGTTRPIAIIPHGSYIGQYPPGRARDVVRSELGVPPDAFAFLCFGHLRAYKAVELLVDAFAEASLPASALIVAGLPLDSSTEEAVRAAAARDSRIKPQLEFVPDGRVAELFAAADAAVLPRGDGGTSGALVLALSMGLGVVVSRCPDYEALTGGEAAGWFFTPGDSASLARALEQSARDPEGARLKAEAARRRADSLSWPKIGSRTATLLVGHAGVARLDDASWGARPEL